MKKEGVYGKVVAMETEAHGALFQYVTLGLGTTESPVGAGADGAILLLPDEEVNPVSGQVVAMPYLMAGHPKVFSQVGGHGVFGCQHNGSDGVNCTDNDGLVYAWQGGNADNPNAGECADGKQGSRHYDLLDACGYRLVALDDWGGSTTVADPAATQVSGCCRTTSARIAFGTFTNFKGNDDGGCGEGGITTCVNDASNSPWQWRDHNGVGSGDWLSDPARLFDIDFEGPEFQDGSFSHHYVRNPYYTHEVQIVRTLVALPVSDPELSVYVRSLPASDNEQQAITPYHWSKRSYAADIWYPWEFGGDEARRENTWSQAGINRYRFTRQTQDFSPDTGAYANGGRSIFVTAETRHPLPSPFTGFINAPVVSRELGPNDWSSGSCLANDDIGCLGPLGAYDHCRVQINDYTCNGGASSDKGNMEFKLTRIIRPSPPPLANAGPDQTMECDSPKGNVIVLNGNGSSVADGNPIRYRWSAPGITLAANSTGTAVGQFPPRTTTVAALTISDGDQDASDSTIVAVLDRTPPTIACPANRTVSATSSAGAVVAYAPTADDRCSAVTVVCVPPSGTIFTRGSTNVSCVATDSANLTAACAFKVSVLSTDLSISNTAATDLKVQVGGQALLTYTIRVANSGPGIANAVLLSDPLPGGLQFVSANISQGTCSAPAVGAPGTVRCSVGTLQSGGSATATIVTKVRSGIIGIATVTNTATVTAGTYDPNSANNTAPAKTRVVTLLNQ